MSSCATTAPCSRTRPRNRSPTGGWTTPPPGSAPPRPSCGPTGPRSRAITLCGSSSAISRWVHRCEHRADENGVVRLQGFAGDYTVEIDGQAREVTVPRGGSSPSRCRHRLLVGTDEALSEEPGDRLLPSATGPL